MFPNIVNKMMMMIIINYYDGFSIQQQKILQAIVLQMVVQRYANVVLVVFKISYNS